MEENIENRIKDLKEDLKKHTIPSIISNWYCKEQEYWYADTMLYALYELATEELSKEDIEKFEDLFVNRVEEELGEE